MLSDLKSNATKDHFAAVMPIFHNMTEAAEKIDQILKIFEQPSYSEDKTTNGRRMSIVLGNLYNKTELAQALEIVIVQGKNACEEASKYHHDFHKRFQVEQDTAREIRRHERRDLWRLWRDRLARWTISAIAAVLLYSAVVWAQQHWSFIKIPIRDWWSQNPPVK